jgi:hypothetical protein
VLYFRHGKRNDAQRNQRNAGARRQAHGDQRNIADIKHEMATKDQVVVLHTQVNAIETQLRDMKHVKLHARVADLEEKVFGAARI